MITVGCDPDLHQSAFAWLVDGVPWGVWVAQAGSDTKGLGAMGSTLSQLCGFEAVQRTIMGTMDEGETSKHPWFGAVEFPELAGRKHRRPDDIVRLAGVAGMCASTMIATGIPTGLARVAEWKGQVPKGIHQARIAERLHWTGRRVTSKAKGAKRGDGYFIPDASSRLGTWGSGLLTDGQWKHVMDAIGIAHWLWKERLAKVQARRP